MPLVLLISSFFIMFIILVISLKISTYLNVIMYVIDHEIFSYGQLYKVIYSYSYNWKGLVFLITLNEIKSTYILQTHLICKIPEYPRKDIQQSVHVQIVVKSGGKSSDPQDFTYKPGRVYVQLK